MSLIMSLLRNYEPLPHTSEAELAAETSGRQYGYNYATRRNVRGSNPDEEDNDDDDSEGSTQRPGWTHGRRFRYDQPETNSTHASTTHTPISSFRSRDASSANHSIRPSSAVDVTTINNIGLTGLLGPENIPAPASFFLSKRNPGLYPGLEAKIKARREETHEQSL
jgi:hypothetical protein